MLKEIYKWQKQSVTFYTNVHFSETDGYTFSSDFHKLKLKIANLVKLFTCPKVFMVGIFCGFHFTLPPFSFIILIHYYNSFSDTFYNF